MMLTQEEISALKYVLEWVRSELLFQEDIGLDEGYIRDCADIADGAIERIESEMSSAGNPADQIGENPHLQALVRIAELVNEYDDLFDAEDELEDHASWDTIDNFIFGIRNALKGVFS